MFNAYDIWVAQSQSDVQEPYGRGVSYGSLDCAFNYLDEWLIGSRMPEVHMQLLEDCSPAVPFGSPLLYSPNPPPNLLSTPPTSPRAPFLPGSIFYIHPPPKGLRGKENENL